MSTTLLGSEPKIWMEWSGLKDFCQVIDSYLWREGVQLDAYDLCVLNITISLKQSIVMVAKQKDESNL